MFYYYLYYLLVLNFLLLLLLSLILYYLTFNFRVNDPRPRRWAAVHGTESDCDIDIDLQ